jgi:hypothetical protein
MKRVGNVGGLVSFEVPESWAVEHENGGTVICYDPADATEATFRLGILVFAPKADLASTVAFGRFLNEEKRRHEFACEELPSGALLVDSFEEIDGGDASTTICYWKLARLGDDGTIRIALFSFAYDRAAGIGKVDVDGIVRGATVSTRVGLQVN